MSLLFKRESLTTANATTSWVSGEEIYQQQRELSGVRDTGAPAFGLRITGASANGVIHVETVLREDGGEPENDADDNKADEGEFTVADKIGTNSVILWRRLWYRFRLAGAAVGETVNIRVVV